MRSVSVVAAVLAAVLGLAAPASAHGPQSLVRVSAEIDRGQTVVTAEVIYLDGDPNVSSTITATASSRGRSVTIPMAKTADPGMYAGRAPLPAGGWDFTVTASGPSKGIGRASIDVHPKAVPASDGSSPAIPGAAVLAGGAVLMLIAFIAVAGRAARRRIRPAA